MRFFFLLAMFFIVSTTTSIAQELKTKKIKEKVTTVKHTKKIFYVLEDNNKIRHGAYEEFVDGEIVVSGNYELGEKEGSWIYKDPKGKYIQKGSFKKGKEVGKWEYKSVGGFYGTSFYSEEGVLESSLSYNANNKLLNKYILNKETKEEITERYLFKGFLEKTIKKDSTESVEIYYPNGQLFSKKIKTEKKLISVSDYFKENGEVFRKSNFKDGTGLVLSFYLDKLISVNKLVGSKAVAYKDGDPFGMYVSYDSNGKPLEQGILIKSQRVGKWREWSSKTKTYNEKDYGAYKAKRKNRLYKKRSFGQLEDVPFVAIQNPPLMMNYDKYINKPEQVKKWFSKMVNENMVENIDAKMLEQFCDSSDGICRFYALFKINTYGEVSDIVVKAKHPIMKLEVARVLNKLPTLIPANQNGRKVNLLFQLPVVFRVKKKKEGSFDKF